MYTYRIYNYQEIRYKIKKGKLYDIFRKRRRLNNIYVIIENLLKQRDNWKELKSDDILRKEVTFSNLSKYSLIKYLMPKYKKIYKKSNLYRRITHEPFYLKHYELTDNDRHELKKIKLDNSLWFLKNTSTYTYGGYDVFPIIANEQMENNVDSAISEMKQFKNYEKNALFVMQKGIDDPLLSNNKKVDFRVYYLITTTNNKISFFVNKYFLMRKTTLDYDKTDTNRTVQLTNTTFQRKIDDDLENLTEVVSDGHYFFHLFPKIVDLLKRLSKIYTKHFVSETPRLELLGVDIMFDKNDKIYLIEVNITPAVYVLREEVVKLHKNIEDHLFAGFVENAMEILLQGNVTNHSFDDYVCVHYYDTNASESGIPVN